MILPPGEMGSVSSSRFSLAKVAATPFKPVLSRSVQPSGWGMA